MRRDRDPGSIPPGPLDNAAAPLVEEVDLVTSDAVTPAPQPAVSRVRLLGIDAARGLAILGMIVAHSYQTEDFSWSSVPSWLDLANGRSSVLFALLLGLSLGIMTGRSRPYSGVGGLQARIRIFARAAMLVLVHSVLTWTNSGIAIILNFFAVWLILALPFVRWPATRIFILAGTIAVIGPLLRLLILDNLARLGMNVFDGGWVAEVMLTGTYPGLPWMAFVLTGLGLSKLALEDVNVQVTLTGVGLLLTALGYGISNWLVGPQTGRFPPLPSSLEFFSEPGPAIHSEMPLPDLRVLLEAGAHSNTPFEVVGATGFALIVIGVMSLLCQVGSRLLYPVIAVGSMALTIYVGHVAWLWFQPSWLQAYDPVPMLTMMVAALAFATAWKLFLGQGPLERGIRAVTLMAARIPAEPHLGS